MADQMTDIQLAFQEKVNSGTAWTKNDKFEKDGYLVIKDLWDPEELYHPLPDMKGQLNYWDRNPEHFHHTEVEQQVEGSLARYWHPQYRTIHTGVRKKLEEILGRKLYNTYYNEINSLNNNQNILFVKYEDLLLNTKSVLNEISKFICININQENYLEIKNIIDISRAYSFKGQTIKYSTEYLNSNIYNE